jgi:two-component system sensor histidine kinase KdpD
MRTIVRQPRLVLSWVAWIGVLVLATLILYRLRASLEQAHVVLIYLLIVLGGTAFGGRVLGFGLAVAGFVLIDYFFQSPYDRLTVSSSLDWFVLIAFLTAAGVATMLLGRAHRAAARAQRHAAEVARLSRIGSELLSAGAADEALLAITDAVRETLGAATCIVFAVHDDGQPERLALRGNEPDIDQTRVHDVAVSGQEMLVLSDGRIARLPPRSSDEEPGPDGTWPDALKRSAGAQSLWMPLSARGRIVGVLVALSESGLDLEEAPRRFAHALRFYAALAVERVRLVAAAEHAAALRETDRLRNALLASVSHDLRTPLTTIKALAQDSERQRDLDRALHNVRVIEEHADRLARVVSNLLDVTRLRANTLPVHPEFNTAEDLIGAVTRQVAGVLGRHPLERRVEERDGVLAGCFDFVQSLRILTNLVENAARYSPPDAPITLSAHRDGESLVLAVADRGAGIPIPERTRIFEPFYRSPAAAPDVGGTGLGLYIARALAEAQGGTLTYAPRMPSGSVFTLRVPALEAPDADGAEVTDDHVEAREASTGP